MARVVDSVIAAFDAARPVLADAFHGDTYSVARPVTTPDGYGGETVTETAVETGFCALDVSGLQGRESLSGATVAAIGFYVCELPIDTALTVTDALIVNGRRFRVTDVKRAGELGLFTEASLEAWEGDA